MRTVRHEVVSFSAAAVLHAFAFFVLRATQEESAAPSRATPSSQPDLSFDVDFDDLGAPPPSGDARDGSAKEAEQRVARFVARRAASDAPNVVEPAHTSEGASSDAVTAEPIELEEEGSAPASRPLDLGIGPDGWQRWVAPSKAPYAPRAERTTPRKNRFQVFNAAPVSTTGGLQEGLEEKDRALGLGPHGRVLSALHNGAHTTAAPYVGTARFNVTVHRSGVVEVTLGAASGQVEQWKKVAEHIANDLRAAPPRIAPPRERLKLVVELVAEETMPNGAKITSLHGPRIEAEAPKFKSTEKTLEQLSEDNPTTKEAEPQKLPPIQLDLPGVYLAERGKVCSYRLGVSVMGPVFQGGCDPSNIGAKPQRMVRTRVVEQQLF